MTPRDGAVSSLAALLAARPSSGRAATSPRPRTGHAPARARRADRTTPSAGRRARSDPPRPRLGDAGSQFRHRLYARVQALRYVRPGGAAAANGAAGPPDRAHRARAASSSTRPQPFDTALALLERVTAIARPASSGYERGDRAPHAAARDARRGAVPDPRDRPTAKPGRARIHAPRPGAHAESSTEAADAKTHENIATHKPERRARDGDEALRGGQEDLGASRRAAIDRQKLLKTRDRVGGRDRGEGRRSGARRGHAGPLRGARRLATRRAARGDRPRSSSASGTRSPTAPSARPRRSRRAPMPPSSASPGRSSSSGARPASRIRSSRRLQGIDRAGRATWSARLRRAPSRAEGSQRNRLAQQSWALQSPEAQVAFGPSDRYAPRAHGPRRHASQLITALGAVLVWIMLRVRQSSIVAYLALGVLSGPSCCKPPRDRRGGPGHRGHRARDAALLRRPRVRREGDPQVRAVRGAGDDRCTSGSSPPPSEASAACSASRRASRSSSGSRRRSRRRRS